MKIHELIYTLDTIDSVAQDLTQIIPLVSVMTFSGPLGVGKTSLVSAILKAYGIHEDILSPTFSYFNIYSNLQNQTFYHFDLYRLKSMQDFISAGFEEYLYQPNSVALIEWPEVIAPLIKKNVCAIALEYYGDNRRKISYTISKEIC